MKYGAVFASLRGGERPAVEVDGSVEAGLNTLSQRDILHQLHGVARLCSIDRRLEGFIALLADSRNNGVLELTAAVTIVIDPCVAVAVTAGAAAGAGGRLGDNVGLVIGDGLAVDGQAGRAVRNHDFGALGSAGDLDVLGDDEHECPCRQP